MVSRSAIAALLMLALAPASEIARAQAAVVAPATPAVKPATAGQATATTTAAPTAGGTTAASTPAKSASKKRQKAASKPVEKPAEAVVQPPPPPPPTPEESPAAAPQVTYQNGQLSIRSENSTLGSILSAVKARTGASLDGPGVSSPDRVATQLGPGDPRDVLTTLLSSTRYDYMLVGAPDKPNSVQKIILTARATGAPGATGPTPGAAVRRPVQNDETAPEQPDVDQSLPDAEIPDDGANQAEEPPQPEAEQPEPQPEQQQQPVPNGFPGQATNGEGDQQNANQPKSPEQLLQELQRMQQQQQQQIQTRPDEPR